MVLELPPVEQVEPGLWSLPVPIPDNPLGYTLVYLLDSDRGPVLVDTGWNDPATFEALEQGMADAGYELDETYGVLLTHHHPDHHGLSGAVREVSGAWIAMHPADAEVISHRLDTEDAWVVETAAILLSAGASEEDLAMLPSAEQLREHAPPTPAVPNRLVGDGDACDVPGWDLRAVWTPGHSPGHLCFVVDRYEVILSGDHVLPEISPHVGLAHPEDEADPLGDYLRSLRKLRELEVVDVLPAHEYRFSGLDTRLQVLLEHHEQRFETIRTRLSQGPATGWEVAESMPWNRSWDEIPAMMKRAAFAEALAHLRCLERAGEVAVDTSTSPARFHVS